MSESKELFSGILESARSEAKAIEKENTRDCDRLKEQYEDKKILAKAQDEQFLAQKREEAKRISESQKTQMLREQDVAVMKELRSQSEAAVFSRMAELAGTPEYHKALVSWIAEGAISLDRSECIVSRGKHDEVSEEILKEAAALVKKIISRDVKITLSKELLSSQGVVVSSSDNRIAYTNLVRTRLARSRSEFENLLEGVL